MRLTDLFSDFGHAVRQLRRRPAYATMALVTLGLGIGASVALYTVADGVLIRSLPFADESQVQVFWDDGDWRGAEYDFVRERPGVFTSLAAYSTDGEPWITSAASSEGARVLRYVVATHTLADVLGARPMLGQWFTADDDRPGAAPVIVISYGVWQQDLGGAPDVIGREIVVGGRTTRVVGVMPPSFYFPTPELRAWVPLRLDPSTDYYRDVGYLIVLGRASGDASPGLIAGDMKRIGRALGERFTYPAARDKTKDARGIPVRNYLLGDVRGPVYLLLGAVALLFLIAGANTASLVLARATDRSGEMAVRAALGADRWRLARQLGAESLVLAVAGAAIGVAVATIGFPLLVARLPLHDSFGNMLSPGFATIGAALVLALVVTGAVSVIPMRSLLRGKLGQGFGRERSEAGLRGGTRRAHGAIVVGQVTLAVVLVVGATLLVRSAGRILSIDPGFEPAGVTTFTLVTSDEMPNQRRRQFYRDLAERVTALPGVTAAGLISRLPLRDGGYESVVRIEGRPDLEGAQRPNALYRNVTPGFFRAMGMRLREGRFIDSTDAATAEPVTVITESFARTMWPAQSALDKHVGSSWSGTLIWRRVVGVIAEPKLTSMTGDSPFAIFVPLEQHGSQIGGEVLVVRGGGDVAGLVPSVRAAAAGIDPRVGMTRISTMDEVVAAALAQPLRLRFFFSVFALLALALGIVGVYGVVAYAVARRRAEFGVRMALGATPARVRVDVMRFGLAPVALGVVAGLAGAGAMGGILTRFLYGFTPRDPASFVVAALVLLIAGAGAAIVPAIRASRTSPVEALRAE